MGDPKELRMSVSVFKLTNGMPPISPASAIVPPPTSTTVVETSTLQTPQRVSAWRTSSGRTPMETVSQTTAGESAARPTQEFPW